MRKKYILVLFCCFCIVQKTLAAKTALSELEKFKSIAKFSETEVVKPKNPSFHVENHFQKSIASKLETLEDLEIRKLTSGQVSQLPWSIELLAPDGFQGSLRELRGIFEISLEKYQRPDQRLPWGGEYFTAHYYGTGYSRKTSSAPISRENSGSLNWVYDEGLNLVQAKISKCAKTAPLGDSIDDLQNLQENMEDRILQLRFGSKPNLYRALSTALVNDNREVSQPIMEAKTHEIASTKEDFVQDPVWGCSSASIFFPQLQSDSQEDSFCPAQLKALASILTSRYSEEKITQIQATSKLDPGVFHSSIVENVGRRQRSLILGFKSDRQIKLPWSYPVVEYQYSYFNPETLQPSSDLEKSRVPVRFSRDLFKTLRHPNTSSVVGVVMTLKLSTYTRVNLDLPTAKAPNRFKVVHMIYDLEFDSTGKNLGGMWYQIDRPLWVWTPIFEEFISNLSEKEKYLFRFIQETQAKQKTSLNSNDSDQIGSVSEGPRARKQPPQS